MGVVLWLILMYDSCLYYIFLIRWPKRKTHVRRSIRSLLRMKVTQIQPPVDEHFASGCQTWYSPLPNQSLTPHSGRPLVYQHTINGYLIRLITHYCSRLLYCPFCWPTIFGECHPIFVSHSCPWQGPRWRKVFVTHQNITKWNKTRKRSLKTLPKHSFKRVCCTCIQRHCEPDKLI